MILRFHGLIALGDECRCSDETPDGAVLIGGRDVVKECESAQWSGPVTVAIGDERFVGPLNVELGCGYSEWTPVEEDSLWAGPHNLVEILVALKGAVVRVWIADEPVNLVGDANDG